MRNLTQRVKLFLNPKGSASETGALPDFVIIGAQKGGTTLLYHLLTQHPYVEAATTKELHYFDWHLDKGIEWYRRCFQEPRWKDGQKIITGEATPYYLYHPPVPEKMARVVPQARLIVLLRNPVDRAYSHYHQQVSIETLNFEEAIAAEEARLRGERDMMFENKHPGFNRQYFSYFSRGIYVDRLVCWSKFFSKEQTLVLKCEDFFEHPQKTLKLVLGFLNLPDWEPEASELRDKRNKGNYQQKIDQATKQRLEDYFEPHNRRLYEYLGVDFGW